MLRKKEKGRASGSGLTPDEWFLDLERRATCRFAIGDGDAQRVGPACFDCDRSDDQPFAAVTQQE